MAQVVLALLLLSSLHGPARADGAAAAPAGDRGTGGGDRSREKRLAQVEARLADLERDVAVERRRCLRIDRVGDRDEVLIVVGGGVLRFVRVKPPATSVAIGLAQERAQELHREAQEQSEEPLLPWIFRSVPAVARAVEPFLLQDRLIDPSLYAELLGDARADARAVSYRQAELVLDELNARCAGRAVFALPTEEQFVAAARLVYDPAANGLKPCAALRRPPPGFPVAELFGHAWQLTGSICAPLAEDEPRDLCPEDTYVRKGGDATSTNPLECIPEFRSAAPADVAQPGTSFRLVLIEDGE